MLPNENARNRAKDYNAIVASWPVERIKALSELPRLSIHKLSGILGITRRTLHLLMDGTYTPSATLCRRMEMIETEAKSGVDLATDILPARSEMRRRLLLFRSWWLNRDPSRELPEITVSIKISWGKGIVNNFEIPAKTLPRLRIVQFSGLVETVRAVITSLRKVSRGYAKLLWTEMDEAYWQAYATNELPAMVEKRSKIPANAARARKWRPVKS